MIISCYPCTGKTYLAKHDIRFIDMESSEYHWLDFDSNAQEQKKEHYKELNPDWPSNYVKAILEQKRLYPDKYILISCQPEVLDALENVNVAITYIYPYPSAESLKEYHNRMVERGNSEEFVVKMDKHFYDFIKQLRNRKGRYNHIEFWGDCTFNKVISTLDNQTILAEVEERAGKYYTIIYSANSKGETRNGSKRS